FADLLDLLFQRELVEVRNRETEEKTDSAIEDEKCLPERLFNFFRGSVHSGRIRNAPMGGHRFARPYRTTLFGSLITDSEHEVQFRSIGSGELRPIFTA